MERPGNAAHVVLTIKTNITAINITSTSIATNNITATNKTRTNITIKVDRNEQS